MLSRSGLRQNSSLGLLIIYGQWANNKYCLCSDCVANQIGSDGTVNKNASKTQAMFYRLPFHTSQPPPPPFQPATHAAAAAHVRVTYQGGMKDKIVPGTRRQCPWPHFFIPQSHLPHPLSYPHSRDRTRPHSQHHSMPPPKSTQPDPAPPPRHALTPVLAGGLAGCTWRDGLMGHTYMHHHRPSNYSIFQTFSILHPSDLQGLKSA